MPKFTKKATKKTTRTAPKGFTKPTAAKTIGAGVWPAASFPNFTTSTTPKNMESLMNNSQSQFDAFSKDQGAAIQETMQAYMKSGKIASERMQELMNTYTQMAQELTEKQTAALKNMMTCKTLNEVTEAQSQFAQSSFDDMMQTFTKMTEMGIKFATEAMEPLNDQVGKAIKKATSKMAA